MKNAIVKAVVLCTLALSLLFVGVASVSFVNTDAAVAALDIHDGEYDDCMEY